MSRSKRLFWRVMAPLAVTFALLWLGIMAAVIQRTCQRLEGDVEASVQSAEEQADRAWENHPYNRSAGSLRAQLSSAALNLNHLDGGMALMIWAGGEEFRSQLAWGFGYTEDYNEGAAWYLEFDSGLDDAGQIAFARWLMERLGGSAYTIYPPDSQLNPEMGDGTYARAIGWETDGNVLQVQRLELVHPDGSVETVMETSGEKPPTHTVLLRYLRLDSALLPGWSWSDNTGTRFEESNMARRLANYREAQAILDRELAGEERSVLTEGGRLGVRTIDGVKLYTAYQCTILPPALKQNVPIYVSTLILAALVLLGLSRHLSRRVTGPVEALSCRAEAGEPCPEDGPIRELNTLAAAVNTGRGKLEEQMARERAFTRAAAHELKTPLAVLRSHAEALKEDIDPAKRGQYLDVVLDESDRMAALVGRLLALSRLERAVEELAANALRYTPAGGGVDVRLERRGDALRLTVDNDGAGFTAEELSRLWEPFWRSDEARSRATGGTGLGLAMVKAAVEAQGGRCGAENRPGGVRFWLELPALQSDG